MECSDGVAPLVKQDAFWKQENTNSDELELDFEPDVKENAISSLLSIQSDTKTEDSDHASLTFSAVRNGGNLSQNETIHTCANADSTNDETVVTSTNEKPESRVAVPTGLLLYRLFNKIIIEALLSSNSCVDGSKYNSNDTNNNNNNSSSNKTKSSASGNGKVDSISNTQEWVDKHYLIFKSNALSVDSTMEKPTDRCVDNVTKDVPVDDEMSIVNETTVTTNDNRLCVAERSVEMSLAGNAIAVNRDQHRVVNRESVVVCGGSTITKASCNHRVIDSLDAQSDSPANIPLHSFTSDVVREAYFERIDVCKGFNEVVERNDDTEVVENSSKSVDAAARANIDEHYSSDDETDSESGDSDFMTDDLAGSSVTSVKLASDGGTLVKRRSIIDDKIINDVFECFKRKLIETINNEIILSLNADRRQNVVSSCDNDIGNEDYAVGHFNDDARRNTASVNNNCVNDVDDVSDVNNLNSVILGPVDVSDAQKNFNFNVLSGGLKRDDNGGDSIVYDNVCGADSVSHKESSALKRKVVVVSDSSVSTDYISCSATDTNCNQIKKIKVNTLKPVDEAAKQYDCTNCNTKRKFLSGSAYGKRKRYDCKMSDKGYVSDTFPYDVDGFGRSSDEKSGIVSESRLDVNDCEHYDCNLCCKVFNDLNVYKNHKIYCRNKNFDCNLKLRYKNDTDSNLDCGRRNDGSDVRDETDSCFYICNICGALSQDDELLNVHLASHSLDNQLYYVLCQLCDRRYYVKSLYLSHLKTVHMKLLCRSCNELFDSDVDLNDHAQLCSISIFSDSDALFEHSYSKYADVGIGSCRSVNSDGNTVPVIAKSTVKQMASTIKDFQNI